MLTPPRCVQAQQCCEGGSLQTVINRAAYGTGKRHYAYTDALRWATQVAKALQYLHESRPQVIHRCAPHKEPIFSGTRPL